MMARRSDNLPLGVLERPTAQWAPWLLGAAIVAHLLMMGSLFWGYLDSLSYVPELSMQSVDFFAIYDAGQRALENESVYSYDLAEPTAAPYSSPYRYVPFFAYAVALPASAIPPWPAYWGWIAFNELLLVANAFATWRIAGRGKWAVIAAAMWFVFPPFYLEQFVGQFSFLMATALFWVGIGIVRRREIVAGIPWAVSLVTKSNSALLMPLFLSLGWWRSLIGGAALVGLNVPYFICRPDDLRFFYRTNFTGSVTGAGELGQHTPAYHSALAFVHNTVTALGSPPTQISTAYTATLIIGVVGCSLGATFLARKTDPLALFAIWVSAFFLFYWVVWEFHYVMLLPALVLLVTFRPAIRPLALAVFVLVALPTPYWLLNHVWITGPKPQAFALFYLQDVWPAWGVILYHAVKPAPVAVLWAYLVVSQFLEKPGLGCLSKVRASSQRAD